jgi:hypothetical protein
MGNGSVYEGVFVDGEIEGHGVRTWPDGTRYVGNFDNPRVSALLMAAACRYEGEFKQGEFHGRGVCNCSLSVPVSS